MCDGKYATRGMTATRNEARGVSMVRKAAVIGAGIMGSRYAALFAKNHRTELVAVCDLDVERATQNAEPFGAAVYGDYREMFEKESLDLVYIATPDPYHRAPVIAAAEAGVNILVEKPLATTVEDALAMWEAVKKAGVKAEVNFSNRWNPPFVVSKQVLDSGEIGEVVSINARLNSSILTPTKRLPWAAQSTVAWFLHTHSIDLATWLTNKRAVSVYAVGVKKKLVSVGVDTYDSIHAVLRYEDGSDAIFEANWILPEGMAGPVDFKYEVMCTEGALYMDTHDQMIHKVTSVKRTHETTLSWTAARMDAYLDMLGQDRPPAASFPDGVENTKILVALHRSLETNAVENL